MTALPNPTVDAIYKMYESKAEERRPYLGCSTIGEECRRKLWLGFRWADSPTFPGRILRLFETGHREEERLIENLKAIGCRFEGSQHEVSFFGGHMKGHIDGAFFGLPESPKTWHLFEAKTMSKKYFDALEKEGLEKSKPVYWAQAQIYMGGLELTRCAHITVCKDDDRIYLERIKFDETLYKSLLDKASAIIQAESPPDRISNSRGFYLCKFCDHAAVCWHEKTPNVNCRTCVHSTPNIKTGLWDCGREIEAMDGCHIYIPSLLGKEPLNGDVDWIEYDDFVNVANGAGFPASDKKHLRSEEISV